MNVRLSVGTVANTAKGMRTAGWCMVLVALMAGGSLTKAMIAESMAATQTTLAVATNNAGPRTRVTLTAHVTGPEGAAPSGVVNFRSGEKVAGDTDLGSALLDVEGNASLQTENLTAGSHQVVAVYQGATGYVSSISKSAQVQAHVSTVAGFTVAAAPTALSTPAGGFVNVVVTVTPVNGFNGYVTLSCNGLPYNATCTFTPLNVLAACTGQACTPGTSVMQIQTLTPSPYVAPSNHGSGGVPGYAFVFPALFGLAGLGSFRRCGWRNLAIAILAFAAAFSMTACAQRYDYLNHGPPGNPGTPLGSYIINVEAESSTGAVTTTPPTQPQITLTITAAKS